MHDHRRKNYRAFLRAFRGWNWTQPLSRKAYQVGEVATL